MRILGITKETLLERKKMEDGLNGDLLMSNYERNLIKKKKEEEDRAFNKKTEEFLDFIFT
jgi:hypothetical protein